MDSKKNVHIGGVFYGMHNIGDEAILYSMLRQFYEKYRISVESYDSKWLLNYYPDVRIRPIIIAYGKPKLGIAMMPRKKIITNTVKQFRNRGFIQKIDGYICGGATILSDCPWHSLKTVEEAGRLGKDVILWGVGMADGVDQVTKQYIRSVLNRSYVSKIYTRDEFVKERLKEIGVKAEKLGVSYDPAIMLSGKEFDLKKYMSNESIEMLYNDRKNICVSVSGEADVAFRTPVDAIYGFTKQLLMRGHYNIYFIPTGCGKHCKDKEIMERIVQQCDSKYVRMIDKEFEPDDLVQFLKMFDFSISSRLHLNIFSACAGIPSIGLIRNSKITDFAQIFDFPVLEMDTLTAEKLLENVELIEHKMNEFRSEIPKKVTEMRK